MTKDDEGGGGPDRDDVNTAQFNICKWTGKMYFCECGLNKWQVLANAGFLQNTYTYPTSPSLSQFCHRLSIPPPPPSLPLFHSLSPFHFLPLLCILDQTFISIQTMPCLILCFDHDDILNAECPSWFVNFYWSRVDLEGRGARRCWTLNKILKDAEPK